MGSECSILNDTKHDVWITHGINWDVLIGVVGGLFALFTAGAGLAALGAAEGEGCLLYVDGEMIYDAEGVATGELTPQTIGGLTKKGWTIMSIVLGLTDASLAKVLGVQQKQAEELKRKIKDFKKSAERITPGNKYTWSGTLSLTMRVYCMNDKLQTEDRACFTGPTAGSENVYPISEYFQTLDV